jgi:hypothetical protein
MDPMRLPKIMNHWKPKEGKNKAVPGEPEKMEYMNERDLRMGEWNNRRQWNMKVGRRRQTF